MRRSLLAALLLALTTSTMPAAEAIAQERRPVPYPVLYSPQYQRALDAGTRAETGEPGASYWTNTATYTIDATLSPETAQLRAAARLTYTNNSPDALLYLLVHLRQNLHAPGVVRTRPQQVTGGVHLARVTANGEALVERRPRRGSDAPGYRVEGTVMRVTLPAPLAPGATASLDIAYSFEVPEPGAPRMGQDGEVFYLAYWYPQFAVYDDVEGWVADPYMGNGEFYMGYADYDVAITLPEGYLVAATGTLQNPEEVLSAQSRDRLAAAAQSHDAVSIVGADERVAGTSTIDAPDDMLTWRFRAENVRDFAFGASDAYLWDATYAETGAGRSGIHAFYRPDATGPWDRSAEFSQFSIEFLSDYFLPYPYPHMTAVEGIIGGGMEFPMITLVGGNRNVSSLFGVTFHEIAHMWFPMLVGQNEKRFTWMDEGLTSFNTNEGASSFFSEDRWAPGRQGYYRIAGTGLEVEPMRHGDRYPLTTPARGLASYSKPAVALHALRAIVGDDAFQRAYRTYAARWVDKHPYPEDLFNTFEDVIGEDLDWFWTTMFYETWTLDQAVASVETRGDMATVTIDDLGVSPFPVLLTLTYEGGATREERIPVDVWLGGARRATLEAPARLDGNPLVRAEIDAALALPDVERSNNVWTRQ